MVEEAENVREFIDVDLGVLWTPPGVGLDSLWRLPLTHRFFSAACIHDCFADLMRSGLAPFPTSEVPNKIFYKSCLLAAGDSIWYKEEAEIFYSMTQVWGQFRWKVEGYPEVIKKIYEAQIKDGAPLTENTKKYAASIAIVDGDGRPA